MIGRFIRIQAGLLATALFLAGCGQERKEGMDMLARGSTEIAEVGPDLETIPVPPDYVSGAIVATGGLQEWMKTRKLELDGVVTLYQSDGSVYLTEQRYQIYPWSNSIRVSAVEPQGEFVCELSGYGGLRPDELQDGFRARRASDPLRRDARRASDSTSRQVTIAASTSWQVLAGARVVDALPAQVSERDLADAILTIATASIRFLDRSAKFTRASEPVKMQGLWYYPIERAPKVLSGAYWSKVVFYQNRNSSLVDMVWFADPLRRGRTTANVEEGKFFAVRGYDYSRVQKRGVLLPAKIEIFRTDARGALSERVAQVNFE